MNVDDLAEKVFLKRPILREILNTHGQKSLLEYSFGYPINSSSVSAERKKEFVSTVCREVRALLGEAAAAGVESQLLEYYYLSTADHHGPLNHPYFVQT